MDWKLEEPSKYLLHLHDETPIGVIEAPCYKQSGSYLCCYCDEEAPSEIGEMMLLGGFVHLDYDDAGQTFPPRDPKWETWNR